MFYDLKKNQYQIYNQDRASTRFYPASSFKILNTLAAFETGVAQDENFFLKWDGITRPVMSHNQDHTLKLAFKNSTLWFYQEIARRIGLERMQILIDKAQYGNHDIGDKVDEFWLHGPLEISALEQVEFLKQLYLNKLMFSIEAQEKTKKVMIRKETAEYTIRSKTGTTHINDKQLCWYVGYIEKKNNAYIFAMNLDSPKPTRMIEGEALKARLPLTNKILRECFKIL